MKTIHLTKENTAKLFKQCEQAELAMAEHVNPYMTVGYMKQHLKMLKLQLKGEFPI